MATGPTSPLGSISLPEAIAKLAEGPARRMVIDPLVAREETWLLASQPREGKTWWQLAGGLAVADGEMLAGRFPTVQTNVLYCTNEDGLRAVTNRLQVLMNGLGRQRIPDNFRLFVGGGLWLDDKADYWQGQLIKDVRAFEIGLVIFDPLRSVTGCVDKGPSELQPFARFLRRLITETGCAPWCSHHEIKPSAGSFDDRRPAQRAAGGGLFAHFDAPISIEHINDTKALFVPDGFKFCDTPTPFIVQRLVLDGEAVILTASDRPKGQTGAELALVEEVRSFLGAHPGLSGSKIVMQLKKQKERVFEALWHLHAAGEARFDKVGKAHLWELCHQDPG
jgi:hypothetical protein